MLSLHAVPAWLHRCRCALWSGTLCADRLPKHMSRVMCNYVASRLLLAGTPLYDSWASNSSFPQLMTL